jgi:hypothetical protein
MKAETFQGKTTISDDAVSETDILIADWEGMDEEEARRDLSS